MQVLFLMQRNPERTAEAIIGAITKDHSVETVDLREEKDYGRIVDLIAGSDRVISW